MKRFLARAVVAALVFVAASCGGYSDCEDDLVHPNTSANPFPDTLGYPVIWDETLTMWFSREVPTQFIGPSSFPENSPIFDADSGNCYQRYPRPVDSLFGKVDPQELEEKLRQQLEQAPKLSPEDARLKLEQQLRRLGIDPQEFYEKHGELVGSL